MERDFENMCCPACRIIDKFGDKWSLLILIKLEENHVMRFNEMFRSIPAISQKMLTTSLRSLEELNLIERKMYPEIPPRVEYKLTELGHGLVPHINNLILWIQNNLTGSNKDCKQEQSFVD